MHDRCIVCACAPMLVCIQPGTKVLIVNLQPTGRRWLPVGRVTNIQYSYSAFDHVSDRVAWQITR